MFNLDYVDVALEWGSSPYQPNDPTIDDLVRDDLRLNVLPITPADLYGHFVHLAGGGYVFVYGRANSTAFHCLYFP